MTKTSIVGVLSAAAAALLLGYFPQLTTAQQSSAYRLSEDWASLPSGVDFGPVASVAHQADGTMHVLRRSEPAFFTLDADGRYIRAWGERWRP
ncbi:MAG TPA: hypothetical protein QGG47_05540 [Acidobacteriota bacterium]|nr:hypothetical protein [Acidobacteriota bacterium]